MSFSSLLFIYAFFPLSLGIFYVTPKKLRKYSLLLLSVIFCGMVSLKFLIFIICFMLMNFYAGIAASKLSSRKISWLIAGTGVAADIASLLLISFELKPSGVTVGTAFFTMSAIGYLIDTVHGKIKTPVHLTDFALFIMFFPKLPIGPPMSYSDFIHNLNTKKCSAAADIQSGLTMFVTGLAKEVIFAGNLYPIYKSVRIIDVGEISVLSVWLGAAAYILFLYFMLSGIADMGAGISRCFGIRIPKSFDHPVFSVGISEFSSRWHMPVCSWFREYVQNPFINIFPWKAAEIISIIIVWALTGLVYGFSVNKLIWGLLIGSALAVETVFSSKKALRATALIYTFALNVVSIIFFFGSSLSDSLCYLPVLIGSNGKIGDTVSIYLLRSYAVVLIAGIYASTDLFRNMTLRIGKFVPKVIFNVVSAVFMLALLVLCTALISFNGVGVSL